MRVIIFSVFILPAFFSAIKLNAQTTAVYRSGEPLRIDFQGSHSQVNRRAVTSNYTSGNSLRLDFQGSHRVVDRSNVSDAAYTPGPALRLDFEGKHRKEKN